MPNYRHILAVFLYAGVLFSQVLYARARIPVQRNDDNRVFSAINSNDQETLKSLVEENPNLLEGRNSYLQTPLIYAISRSNLDLVRTLLKLGANENAIDGNHKKTPLHWAITFRQPETIDLLLKYKPDRNARDIADETPLDLAIRFGVKGKRMSAILEGSDLVATNKQGKSTLYIACWNRRWEVAETLIDKLDDKELGGSGANSPINVAYTFDGEKVVAKLLGRGCRASNHVDHRGETILIWAIRKNNVQIVKALLQQDISLEPVQNNTRSPLLNAVYHRSENVIPLLLEHGVDVSVKESHSGARDVIAVAIQSKLDVKIIRQLISHSDNFDPNAVTGNGTYLGFAADAGAIDSLQLLLDRGADINSTKSQYTALMSAAMRGNVDAFDFLIKSGARRDIIAKDGSTLFLRICQSGNLELIKREIKTTKDINTPNNFGATPFYFASFSGSAKQICELLMRHGAKADSVNHQGAGSYPTPLHFYSTLLDLDLVEFFLKSGVKVNCCSNDGNRASHNLAAANIESRKDGRQTSIAICKLLQKSGADFSLANSEEKTPVDIAIVSEKYFLLPHMVPGFDFDQVQTIEGQLLIQWVSKTGHQPTFDALMAHKAKTDVCDIDGNTPLMLAVKNGHHDIAMRLLKTYRSIGHTNKTGQSALELAVVCGDVKLANALIANGANKHRVDRNNGESLLHLAIWNNQASMVEALVGQGLDVNQAAKTGATALHRAAWKGNSGVCKTLIAAKADVNAADNEGVTPLYVAAMQGHLDVVKVLVKHGADVEARNEIDISALEIAAGQGHVDIVQYLTSVSNNSK